MLSTVTGIIPARAGFTDTEIAGLRVTWDHPRSRGVYRPPVMPWLRATGSSPLARGLPGGACSAHPPDGIIPARAGFTRGYDGFAFSHWDHPRSRGVYGLVCVFMVGVVGSSPLARGLPAVAFGAEDSAGIIPARAGFTDGSRCPTIGTWDHPRSRGVYQDDARSDLMGVGSSPLARGLQLISDWRKPLSRIIPARAGFTRRGLVRCLGGLGSSPLARGLRRNDSSPSCRRRIIPARAGFTHPDSSA